MSASQSKSLDPLDRLPNPFLGMGTDLSPRVFQYDEAFAIAFLAAVRDEAFTDAFVPAIAEEAAPEDIPAFLGNPRPEYLQATERMEASS